MEWLMIQPKTSVWARLWRYRLSLFMNSGLVGLSEFAGWDSQAESTRCVKIAFDRFTGSQSRGFAWVRASDIDELPQRVLMQMSNQEGGHCCVAGDINDRLPQVVRGILDQAEPATVESPLMIHGS